MTQTHIKKVISAIETENRAIIHSVEKIDKALHILSQNGVIQKKSSSSKASKTVKPKVTIREAIRDVLKNGSMSASDIYHGISERYGQWSRHSLYRVLKDKEFHRSGNEYSMAGPNHSKTAKAA